MKPDQVRAYDTEIASNQRGDFEIDIVAAFDLHQKRVDRRRVGHGSDSAGGPAPTPA
jgi:hypothetical protein